MFGIGRLFDALANHRRESQRLLLTYWDGQTTRRGDPFRLQRDLNNHATMNMAEMSPDVDAGKEPATTIMVEAIAEVFGVKRWDGTAGLTDWEILNLLAKLDDYLLALKKNTSLGLTSSPPTAPAS
jgi:hypothetical protein